MKNTNNERQQLACLGQRSSSGTMGASYPSQWGAYAQSPCTLSTEIDQEMFHLKIKNEIT
jgi:hypothetical protein